MKTDKTNLIATCVRSCVVMVALCLGALSAGADVNIDENTELTGDVDYRGQGTVTIAADVTLDLCGHKLFVDGLAGTGTVTDSTTPPGENLIADGSFENVVVTGNSGAWGYFNGTAAASEKWHTDTPKYAGFTKANTPWANDVKGSVSAFIQITANLWQTVTIAEAGDYALTYSYKSRKGYISHEMNVVVDAQVCGKTSSDADWAVNTVILHLEAGEHTIKFAGLTTKDSATVFDKVSLRHVPGELHVVVPEGETADVSSVKFEGAFRLVNEGAGTCLLNADCDWTALDVVIDTTLDLRGHNLSVSELKGTGMVTDSTALGANLIEDGSFEETTVIKSGRTWGHFIDGTASSGKWHADDLDHDGFTLANSPWAADVKGTYSAYVQGSGDLWQTVTVTDAGDYALTYSYKSRLNYPTHDMAVVVDGGARFCGRTDSAPGWAANTVVLHLTAGEHKVQFLGRMAGNATVFDDVSLRKIPAAGELHVIVPEGETAEAASVNLAGALKLVKEGAGTYLVSYKNGGVKPSYLGGTSVREGCLSVHQPAAETSQADYNFYKVQQLGTQGSETTVEDEAIFDCGGNYDGSIYTIVLNGGTYGNMGTFAPNINTGTPLGIRLMADSFAEATSTAIQLGDADLAGHTLTVTTLSSKGWYPCGVVRNGTVVSCGGRFYPRNGADFSTADIVLESMMTCSQGTVPFHDLKVVCTRSDFGHGDANYFTVSGTYTPVSDQIWRFKLMDGSTIDLSGRTTALPVPDANGLFFEENARVYVELGDRQVTSADWLITWSTKPTNVEFCTVPGVEGSFRILDEGLTFVADDEGIPVIAHWTGEGDVSNLADPNNWACTNKYGRGVADAIPAADSTVYLPREISFNPAGTSFTCKEVVLAENSVLKADCDLTGLYVPIETTLDLCGHNLSVSELRGAGMVTDSTALGANLIANGGFEMTTIADNKGAWGYVHNAGNTSSNWDHDGTNGGYTLKDTPWTSDVKGLCSAFIQGSGDLWQTVTVAEAGDYALTYSYKSRKNYGTHAMTVVVDDVAQQCGRTDSATGWAVNTMVLHLAAGEHKVKFLGLMAGNATILDDVSLRKIPAAGELHVVVPEGETAETTSVNLAGVLKLVKEGAGTYLVSYKNGGGVKTSYLGGTSVREGCFKVHEPTASSPNDYNFYQTQQLGARGAETTVEEGAIFDCGGNYDGYLYTIVLNGGTYGNMGTYTPARDTGTPLGIRLTADSFAEATSMCIQLGDADLAGHTLTVTTITSASWYPCGVVRNGTVVSCGGRFYPRKGADFSAADIVFESMMTCSQGTVPFHDLKVVCTRSDFGHGDANYFTVSGTYTPVSDKIWRFKLLNGSTIDLSGRTTALPVPDANGLFFEENATVYVSLGERRVKSSEPLITWTAKPENVKFRAAPGTAGVFVAKDNGLYRSLGFSIIVR